jgi:hypothetical protein
MNNISGFATGCFFVLIFSLHSGSVSSQRSDWYADFKDAKHFLDRQGQLFQQYSIALGEAYYNYYAGLIEDYTNLEKQKSTTWVHRDSMEALFQYWMPKRPEITDTIFLRRIIQWHNLMAASQVNDIPEIWQLQSELERWIVAPDNAKGKPSRDSLEAMTVRLLQYRNQGAKAIGFPGYIEMMLLVTGIQPEQLQYWLDIIDNLSIEPYKQLVNEMKEERGVDELSLQDVFRLYLKYLGSEPPEPEPDNRDEVIRNTFVGLGMDYPDLPIKQRTMQLPPPMAGQGIAVEIPDDFRLVVNPGIQLSTLFHELGHGFACVYCDSPWPVLKGYEWLAGGTTPVMAEGLAEWSAGILRNPKWQKTYARLSNKETENLRNEYKKYSVVNLRFRLYSVWMELESFFNPGQDLDSLNNALMKRFLLVDEPGPRMTPLANAMVISYPVYNHNYLLAEIIQWQIHQELEKRLGPDYLFHPETAALMQQYFYHDGEYYHWLERLGRFTGSGLNIEGYFEWLNN